MIYVFHNPKILEKSTKFVKDRLYIAVVELHTTIRKTAKR